MVVPRAVGPLELLPANAANVAAARPTCAMGGENRVRWWHDRRARQADRRATHLANDKVVDPTAHRHVVLRPADGMAVLRDRKRFDWRAGAGLSGLVGLTCSGLLIAAGSASLASLVPATKGGSPDWLRGPFTNLHVGISHADFTALLLFMTFCYLIVLAVARSVSVPTAVAAIAILHLAFGLAPPIFSADAFGYIGFARLGALHGLNPYLHNAAAAPGDPVLPYVGWPHSTSPYGPLFTLASYGLAPLSVPAALWSLKAIATAASLGCTALVWKLARRVGRRPIEAAIFFGLNPVVLVWAVGGAHNDLLLMLVVLAGVTMVGAGRAGPGLGALVAAAGVKAWASMILPFALVATRRRASLVVPLLVLLAIAIATLAVFGGHAFGSERELLSEQRNVADHSVPNQLGLLIGLGGLTEGIRIVAVAAFVIAVVASLALVSRGADWVAGAGWATLCLLVCSAWLLPWYAVWVLPLAAIGSSRLRAASLAFTCYVIVFRIASPFG
jgi:hypothetical protein